MVLVIDNYDSFTYNLVQFLGELGVEIRVERNDAVDVKAIRAMAPSHIILSPGPGRPEHAGVCVNVVRRYGRTVPILGVCLGHQAVGYAFGGAIVHAGEILHGKTSLITHDGRTIFRGIKSPFRATRYHSLMVARDGLPRELAVSARTREGVIMGLRHRQYPVEGVQFHPESFLTGMGKRILKNFLARTGRPAARKGPKR